MIIMLWNLPLEHIAKQVLEREFVEKVASESRNSSDAHLENNRQSGRKGIIVSNENKKCDMRDKSIR